MAFMRTTLLTTALLLSPVFQVSAEVLILEHNQQSASADKPTRGLSMTEVEARYGVPVEKQAAVGEPPISQWIYADFVVYFEYERVLHAVSKRTGGQ